MGSSRHRRMSLSKRSTPIRRLLLSGAALLLVAPAAALAQASPDETAEQPPLSEDELYDEEAEDAIIIVGQRLSGAVIGDIPPENQLDARDIRAYGAADIGELLEAIAPETGSARGSGGPPVTLLNGQRISGFREIRSLPPEAILRIDILPEEVALKYGYRADQRVVNIVLRPRFRSTSVRAEAELPTAGGRSETELDLTRLMISDAGRTTINLHLERTSPLLESERDIALADPVPAGPDPREFRSLIGSDREARLGGTLNRSLLGVSSTFDGHLEYSDGRSLLGPSLLDPGEPLARDRESLAGHLGLAMNGNRGSWRWSLTGAYDRTRSLTVTERESGGLQREDRARSLSSAGALDLVANGPLFRLPAGEVTTTLKVGADTRDLDSRARRGDIVTTSDLGRDRLSSSVNLDLPVASRDAVLSALGNLTLNGNAEVEQLSDFGTLTTVGAGLYWSPAERLNLIGSWTREQGAPGLQQLGDPVLVTADSRIFDFSRGETVLVEAVTGGNPDLTFHTRNVLKLGGTFRPLKDTDLRLRADYVSTRTDDPIARFPGPTDAVEAAFPERFTRDAGGNLVRVDLRPVNYDSSARDELRWGFTFTKPLESARPSQSTIARLRQARQRPGGAPSAEGAPPSAEGAPPSAEERRGGRGGRGGGPGGGRQGGRLQLSAFHTLLLKDEFRIRPELPIIDFLDGEVAEGGTGRPRHRIEVRAGWFNNALGARLSADWQSGSRVVGGPSGDLEFAPLARFDLRLFANLGERLDLVTKQPWLRGTQVRLGVDNIFDARQKVRDAAGLVPISFQPDLLDPQGRTVSLSIRKLFLPPRSFFRRQDADAS